MRNLGVFYANGWGVPADNAKAMQLFETASDMGDLTAKANLGLIYLNGIGRPIDEAKGRKLLEEAAGGGDAFAKEALSKIQK